MISLQSEWIIKELMGAKFHISSLSPFEVIAQIWLVLFRGHYIYNQLIKEHWYTGGRFTVPQLSLLIKKIKF